VAHPSVIGECKPIRIATSQSAQSLKSLPSFPIPRPFTFHIHDKIDQGSFPPHHLHDCRPSSAANLGLKTPSAFFPSLHHVGHIDAQLAVDHVASSAENSSKHGVQYLSKLPGRDVAQTVEGISLVESTEDKNKFINMPFPTLVPGGEPVQILTYARDGTFVSEQQAHEIAYSTQMPIGLVSQQSKTLDIPREASNHVTGNKHVCPSSSSDMEVNIPDKSKQIARDRVIATFRCPAGVSFSEEIKAQNSQSIEPISDLLCTYDPSVQHRYISASQSTGNGACSFQGLSGKAEFPCCQQGGISGSNFQQDVSAAQAACSVEDSLSGQHHKSSLDSFPTKSGVPNIPKDGSACEYPNSDLRCSQLGHSGVGPQDATFLPYSSNILEQVMHSIPVDGDSMPKSALVMQQSHVTQHRGPDDEVVGQELAGKLQQLTGIRTVLPFFKVLYCESGS
jgi:hypothetical protein